MPSAGREFPLLPPRFPPRCSMFPRTREPGALLSLRRRRPPFRRPGEGPDPALVSSSLGLVIPAEAGIRFDFALALPFRGRVGWGWCWFWFSALSRKPTHVPVFFRPPSLAAESLSLARARESNPGKHVLAPARGREEQSAAVPAAKAPYMCVAPQSGHSGEGRNPALAVALRVPRPSAGR